MRIARDEGDFERFQSFLERSGMCHFAQSPMWAGVKSGWRYELIISEGKDGEIRGGAGVLIRRLPLFGNIIYCPRGPVCESGDRQAMEEMTAGLLELMRRYNALAVRAEPDKRDTDTVFRGNMESLGWRFRNARDEWDTIQPRSVFRLDIGGRSEEQVMAEFHKKLRYNIRLAQRRGVEIVEGRRENIEVFADLMEVTARRDGFGARGREYYYRLWDALGPEQLTLLLAKFDGEVLAGGLFVHMGGKTWYLYGASADERRNMMPCHLMQWEAIRGAIARGDRVYDLRGCLEITDENDPRGGLYRFKRQFGGELERLVGEAYITERPIVYGAYCRAERGYRVVRHRIAGIRGHFAAVGRSSDAARRFIGRRPKDGIR